MRRAHLVRNILLFSRWPPFILGLGGLRGKGGGDASFSFLSSMDASLHGLRERDALRA